MKSKYLIVLLSLAVGILIGYMIAKKSQVVEVKEIVSRPIKTDGTPKISKAKTPISQPPQKDSQTDKKLLEEISKLKEENERLLTENQALKKENAVGIVPVAAISTPIFDKDFNADALQDFKIHPDLVKILELTDEEQGRMVEVFKAAKDSIDQEIKNHTSVVESSPSKVVLRVTPFPKEGKAIEEQIDSSIQSLIDNDRFELFKDIRGHRFYTGYKAYPFKEVGTEKRTLTFSIAEGSSTRYFYEEKSDMGGGSSTTSSTGSSISRKYQIFEPWLSETFQGAFERKHLTND